MGKQPSGAIVVHRQPVIGDAPDGILQSGAIRWEEWWTSADLG